ncbi:hypothetical protein CDG81_03600 [Actinopolyspora erythraea]|uniref:Uncharacterized protein n=1 Tax=Actinopolyspora erythraea TaxID=414996 RepID=A0A223RNT8_9ACTN|nr:DUF5825 family protein [Actinopolyspora erythraea]ASU77543.1 hypothetical protein CDG81_03600 [Actinopolyspora erythraea]
MRVLLRESAVASVAERSTTAVLGTDPVAEAAELFETGVRAVVLREPVHLGRGAEAGVALTLLRELGARGVSCRWELHADAPGLDWTALSHLPPPRRVSGSSAVDDSAWSASWFPCKCVQREGPGFLQIRDRRGGAMECYTVSDPELVRAARQLADGATPAGITDEVRERFAATGLLVRVGALEWWAPARVRRWPVPAMAV